MLALNTIISVALFVLNVFVLYYLDNLEKIGCECAKDWRKTYIYVFLIVSILFSVVFGILYAFSLSLTSKKSNKAIHITASVFSGLMIIASILYIIFSLQYIHRLREIKCTCSKNITRQVWEVVLYIQVALAALGLLIVILSVFFVKDFIQKIPYYKEMKLDKLEDKLRYKKLFSSKSSSKK